MKLKQKTIVTITIFLLSIFSASTISSTPSLNLPPKTCDIKMRAEDGVNSWFNIYLLNVPSGYDVVDGLYPGWCAQKDIQMNGKVNHSICLYSSYDPNLPESYKSENWSKINYVLNHKKGDKNSIQKVIWFYISLEGYPKDDPDAKAMIADADNNSDFVPQPGQIIAIITERRETAEPTEPIQRCFFELTIPTKPSKPPSGSDSGTTETIVTNYAPTADGTAGEPYTYFARGEITFDGSRSYDVDGFIISWKWDLGDGTIKNGEIVKHSYMYPGNYNVTLTVKDEKGATDTYSTVAVIIEGNNPPNKPRVSGPVFGHKNVSYEFTVVSTDVDNDTLQYIINWGDNVTQKTDFVPSGNTITLNHKWVEFGHYTITFIAFDNQSESDMAPFELLIDILYVHELGYLIDEDSDGTFDSFYNNTTGTKTKVEKLDNGNYLIDINGDGKQFYEFNSFKGELKIYQEQPIIEVLIIAFILIICIILFFILEKRRKKSKIEKENK
ncbi:MAG: PKD domain-containing protein [Candidatus Thermoplasmatota archaeon]|nr:PKD domain-containing protein [Candidatus Thermoplasmatota archaeon]